MNNDEKETRRCFLCPSLIVDIHTCARLWVQATPSSTETDLGYYVHLDCCKSTYDSHITQHPTVHFSTSSSPSPSSPPVIEVSLKEEDVVYYPVQHHTDSSRPPLLISAQCLKDL